MIDIEEKHLDEIKQILKDIAPDCEVRAFGSRVEGKAEKFSDLDIVLVSSRKLDWREIERLKDAFAASNLPITIDVLDYSAISEEFRQIINQKYEVIQKSSGKI